MMRSTFPMVLILGCALVLIAPTSAYAQADDATMAGEVRECRQINDVTSRLACYDTIAVEDQAGASTLSAQPSAVSQDADFGANQLARPSRESPSGSTAVRARIANAVQREPGVFLLTLENGTQWQFVDSAPRSYRAPRRGAMVEITGASMGSYLMQFDGQRALRIRRVR